MAQATDEVVGDMSVANFLLFFLGLIGFDVFWLTEPVLAGLNLGSIFNSSPISKLDLATFLANLGSFLPLFLHFALT